MHRLSSAFVLALHGCSQKVGESLLAGAPFKPSENRYDWLGSGIYFWESNPKRALEWASLMQERKSFDPSFVPFVVGAAIDLGFCLDLVSSNGIAAVVAAHVDFKAYAVASGSKLPQNEGTDDDLLSRNLDCAVINHLHATRSKSNRSPFDTVRGIFLEGSRIYEGSGFRSKTHVQICVRNPDAIQGVFRITPQNFQ